MSAAVAAAADEGGEEEGEEGEEESIEEGQTNSMEKKQTTRKIQGTNYHTNTTNTQLVDVLYCTDICMYCITCVMYCFVYVFPLC